jgi:hypothetical protein
MNNRYENPQFHQDFLKIRDLRIHQLLGLVKWERSMPSGVFFNLLVDQSAFSKLPQAESIGENPGPAVYFEIDSGDVYINFALYIDKSENYFVEMSPQEWSSARYHFKQLPAADIIENSLRVVFNSPSIQKKHIPIVEKVNGETHILKEFNQTVVSIDLISTFDTITHYVLGSGLNPEARFYSIQTQTGSNRSDNFLVFDY